MTITRDEFEKLEARVRALEARIDGGAGHPRASEHVRDLEQRFAQIESRSRDVEQRARDAVSQAEEQLKAKRAFAVLGASLQMERAKRDAQVAVNRRQEQLDAGLDAKSQTLKAELQREADARRNELQRAASDESANILRLTNAIDQDLLVLANVSYLYGLMARHWRLSRARVARVVTKTTGGQAVSGFLMQLPATFFGKCLQLSIGGGLGAAFGLASGAVAQMVEGAAQHVGAGSFAHRHIDDWMKGLKDGVKGFSKPLGAVAHHVVFRDFLIPHSPAAQARRGADTLIDPNEFFLETELRLRRITAQLANTRQGTSVGAGGAHAADRFDDVDTPDSGLLGQLLETENARKAARHALGSLQGSSGWATLRVDPVFKALFERSNPASFEANWRLIEVLVQQAMIRLAWTLYCRSQWENLTWDYTVKLDSDFEKGAPARDWIRETPEDWPRGVWARNGLAWPAHFVERIVPDFIGWENDETSPLHPDPASVRQAKERLKRQSHFSRAVVHCCQVRPGRSRTGTTPVDLTRTEAVTFARNYLETGARDGNAKLAAIRTDVHIAEVRFGTAVRGATSGKKGRIDAPNDFDRPYVMGVEKPTAITAIVHTTSRTTKRAHVRLVGPLDAPLERDNNDEVDFAFKEDSKSANGGNRINQRRDVRLSFSKSTEANFHELTFREGIYAVTLEGRKAVEEGDAVDYARDVFYFRIFPVS